MKKKEIVIIALLIAFGFIYNAFEKGKIKFIDDFSGYFDETRLVSEQYLEFPQKEQIFPAAEKITVTNQAGEITIDKSTDGQVHLLAFWRIYFLDQRDVEGIKQKVRVHAEAKNNELEIFGDYEGAFPFKRLRIRLQLLLPEGAALVASNHEGNVSIRHAGKNIFLRQENGNVDLADIPSSLQLEIRRGKLEVKNISGSIAIDAQQTDIVLENVGALRLQGRHGDYALKNIRGKVYIEHAFGSITLDGAEQAEIFGRHSDMTVRNIRKGVKLTNAFERIVLENISGDVNLSSRSSKMDIRHIRASNMVIENSFADIAVGDYSGETLNILLKNGNLDFQSQNIGDRLNIESRYAKISLDLGVLTDPTVNIKTSHGRIYDHSPVGLDIFQEKDESFANRSGQKPEIIINNIYGDIYLK